MSLVDLEQIMEKIAHEAIETKFEEFVEKEISEVKLAMADAIERNDHSHSDELSLLLYALEMAKLLNQKALEKLN